MIINPEVFETLWYEDEHGKRIPHDAAHLGWPEKATIMRSNNPCTLTDSMILIVRQADVDRCRHPRKYRVPTFGWVDGVYGRECKQCHGTQIRHKHHFWPRKWDGNRSVTIFEGHTTWSPDLALAMANSGEYTLRQAILVIGHACERCLNALYYKYTQKDGYPEDSDQYRNSNTRCSFCSVE